MLRFLGLLVVLAVVIASFGYYRGWFHAESTNSNGQGSVTLTVDKAAAQQQVQNLGNK
jgi:hypothetical protein